MKIAIDGKELCEDFFLLLFVSIDYFCATYVEHLSFMQELLFRGILQNRICILQFDVLQSNNLPGFSISMSQYQASQLW